MIQNFKQMFLKYSALLKSTCLPVSIVLLGNIKLFNNLLVNRVQQKLRLLI